MDQRAAPCCRRRASSRETYRPVQRCGADNVTSKSHHGCVRLTMSNAVLLFKWLWSTSRTPMACRLYPMCSPCSTSCSSLVQTGCVTRSSSALTERTLARSTWSFSVWLGAGFWMAPRAVDARGLRAGSVVAWRRDSNRWIDSVFESKGMSQEHEARGVRALLALCG